MIPQSLVSGGNDGDEADLRALDLYMTKSSSMQMRYGLVASSKHRVDHQPGGLSEWAQVSASVIKKLGLQLHVVGGTGDALSKGGPLARYSGMIRYPAGHEGGLMRMVSHVTGASENCAALDGVIYLIDPVDPSTLYPEALALKRQCVIHQKPFLSTVAGAIEWMTVLAVHAGVIEQEDLGRLAPQGKTAALIAHDALKGDMVAFANEHFDVLSRFTNRVATGTTGGLLNEMAWSRGWRTGEPWVRRYQSGPLGGDAQIAELVLDGRCDKVVFFEDPHVARQHEADIQLLERAVCTVTSKASCANSPTMARLWAQAVTMTTSG